MRESYIQMRVTKQYNLQWFFEYYMENKKPEDDAIPFEFFIQIFRVYLNQCSNDVLNHLDRVFEVTKIEDENQEIIYMA